LQTERDYGIPEKDLRKWHSSLQKYFQEGPKEDAVKKFTRGIGFTKEVANEISKNVDVMKANKEIIDILENLYKKFDSLVT
jgi:hypothetical protein